MAIMCVRELFEEMTISETASDGATATRVFLVISDIIDESPAVVMNAVGPGVPNVCECGENFGLNNIAIPALGATFPGTFTVYCTERSPQRVSGSRKAWHVTCGYKSILSKEERDRGTTPLMRKPSIFWKSQKVMRLFRGKIKRSDYYQNYSAAIVEPTFNMKSPTNSASDPFEPILEYPATEWVAVVSKNLASIPTWIVDYEDSVNNASFTIDFYGTALTVPKGCAKLGSISLPVSKQENGIDYVAMSFEIVLRSKRDLHGTETEAPEPWDVEVLDTGTRKRNGTKWENIKDVNEESVTTPVPMNGLGVEIGVPGIAIPESSLTYSLIAPYKRKDFSVFAAFLGP
jgi:hypothetical protein